MNEDHLKAVISKLAQRLTECQIDLALAQVAAEAQQAEIADLRAKVEATET